jgi:hypothetical protein
LPLPPPSSAAEGSLKLLADPDTGRGGLVEQSRDLPIVQRRQSAGHRVVAGTVRQDA